MTDHLAGESSGEASRSPHTTHFWRMWVGLLMVLIGNGALFFGMLLFLGPDGFSNACIALLLSVGGGALFWRNV